MNRSVSTDNQLGLLRTLSNTVTDTLDMISNHSASSPSNHSHSYNNSTAKSIPSSSNSSRESIQQQEANILLRINTHMDRYSYTPEDIQSVCDDQDGFRKLQESLRKRGVVTNTFLKERVHHYVRKQKTKQQQRMPRNSRSYPALSSASAVREQNQ